MALRWLWRNEEHDSFRIHHAIHAAPKSDNRNVMLRNTRVGEDSDDWPASSLSRRPSRTQIGASYRLEATTSKIETSFYCY